LDRLLESYIAYYNEDHVGIRKDSPLGRPVEQRPTTPATKRPGSSHFAGRHAHDP